MAEITSINPTTSAAGVSVARPLRIAPPAPAQEGTDQVEISELARLLSSLDPDEQSRVRSQKVAELREAVQNGTYEIDDKLDYVVKRLMEVLQASPTSPD